MLNNEIKKYQFKISMKAKKIVLRKTRIKFDKKKNLRRLKLKKKVKIYLKQNK